MFATLRKAGSLARVRLHVGFDSGLCTKYVSLQAASAGQRRFLSIHEYQSVSLLNSVLQYALYA